MTEENLKIYDPVEVDESYFAQNEQEADFFYLKARSLSGPILDILFGVETPTAIKNIYAPFGLTPEQSAGVTRLIRKILIAQIYIGNMATEIQTIIQSDSGRARELANALVSGLFADALPEIKKIQFDKFKQLPQSQPQAQPPQNTPPKKIIGEDIPETHGNIINLRN
jgi:hypothetical protein